MRPVAIGKELVLYMSVCTVYNDDDDDDDDNNDDNDEDQSLIKIGKEEVNKMIYEKEMKRNKKPLKKKQKKI